MAARLLFSVLLLSLLSIALGKYHVVAFYEGSACSSAASVSVALEYCRYVANELWTFVTGEENDYGSVASSGLAVAIALGEDDLRFNLYSNSKCHSTPSGVYATGNYSHPCTTMTSAPAVPVLLLFANSTNSYRFSSFQLQ